MEAACSSYWPTPTAAAVIYALFLEYGFLEDKWSRPVLAAVFVNDVITLIFAVILGISLLDDAENLQAVFGGSSS
jgi:hypothetical protein